MQGCLKYPLIWYKYFGLFDKETWFAIPLRKVSINAKINEYLAEVIYSQTFYNNSDNRVEAEYYFPMSDEACFHSFEAKFGTTTIQGVIKEKKKAEEDYQRHKDNGDLVAYADIPSGCNVMCMKLGNIPPMTEIEVSLSYTERVEVYLNKFWRFTIPAVFVSSYYSKEKNPDAELILKDVADSERLIFDLTVLIHSRQPLAFIKSILHEVEITHYKTANIFSAQVSLVSNKRYIPDKDFVLFYTTKSINQPQYLLTPFEYGYCMLLSFIPGLNSLTFDDALRAANQGGSLNQVLTTQTRREYIFVIDKIKSHDESLFALMKETLVSFLQKLPDDSFFNILGMYPSSISYISKSLKMKEDILNNLLKDIDSSSNLGHVKLSKIIQFIQNSPNIQDYSRRIFVLTSRMSRRPINNTIQNLRNKLSSEEIYVLEIKLPNFWSHLGKVAPENQQIHDVIQSKDDISEKVSHILRNSLLPHFTDFDLKIEDESLCAYVIPLPRALSYITLNKLVEFFIIFKKKLQDVNKTGFTLSFFNNQNHKYEKHQGEINIENADQSEAVIRLGMSKFCDSLSRNEKIFKAMKNEMAKEFQKDVSEKLLATSLRYGILTNKTAFVCVIKEGDDILRQIPTLKITASEIKESLIRARKDSIFLKNHEADRLTHDDFVLEDDRKKNLNLSNFTTEKLESDILIFDQHRKDLSELNSYNFDKNKTSNELEVQTPRSIIKSRLAFDQSEVNPKEGSFNSKLINKETIKLDKSPTLKSNSREPIVFEIDDRQNPIKLPVRNTLSNKSGKLRWESIKKIISRLCPCLRRQRSKITSS